MKRSESHVTLFVLILSCSVSWPMQAQNLEKIGKEKPLHVTGGLSINQIFYTSHGINNRRAPYTWFASGNTNLSLYGLSVPISFSFSNQGTVFQQPFNRLSLSPTYKFVTAHIGYISMSFSPYTVNGHLFVCGGVDILPEGKWKLSALYGRFLKAVQPSYDSGVHNTPAYQRMGYGFKAGYNDRGNRVDLILFHANDQPGSSTIPDSLEIFPEENLVLSVAAAKSFLRHFVARAELAGSALSRDVRAPLAETNNVLGWAPFYKTRASSSFYNAFKTSLDFQQDAYTIGVAYERIDPGYRTLGAYFFNNDLENVTVNGNTTILKGKMNIAASGGLQRDNLDHTKVSTMRRTVGSININLMASERLTLATSYSTFQTFTNIRSQFTDINQLTPYDNLDTLNFTQISRNGTLTGRYMLSNGKVRKQSLNVNLSYQGARDQQGNFESDNGLSFYNFNTAYALSLVPVQATLSLSFNVTLNNGNALDSRTYGPVASATKSFFDKRLRLMLSGTYNNTYSNGIHVNRILNSRLSGTLTLRKKHNLNLSTVISNRVRKSENTRGNNFTEFTGTLGYAYSFGSRR